MKKISLFSDQYHILLYCCQVWSRCEVMSENCLEASPWHLPLLIPYPYCVDLIIGRFTGVDLGSFPFQLPHKSLEKLLACLSWHCIHYQTCNCRDLRKRYFNGVDSCQVVLRLQLKSYADCAAFVADRWLQLTLKKKGEWREGVTNWSEGICSLSSKVNS
jgi:hypothetical protein